MAAANLNDLYVTKKLASLLSALAWLCWAFSWYAKPFSVRWGVKLPEAIRVHSLHPKVPPALWNLTTMCAFVLMAVGLLLKFASAA